MSAIGISVTEKQRLKSLWLLVALALFRRQHVDEVLRRGREQGHELLQRRLQRREQHGSKLVLSGHRRELVLDCFRVEERAFDEPGLDLELLARSVLAERLHDLGGRA